MTIRSVYSKLVLPSRKSLEIIINIKIIFFFFLKSLIKACSLIRSNTVCKDNNTLTNTIHFDNNISKRSGDHY